MLTSEQKTKKTGIGIIAAVLLGTLITLCLLAGAALLFCTGKVGYESAMEIITAINFAGAAAVGMLAACRRGGGALKAGLISGAVYCLILILVGLVLNGGELSGSEGARIAICSVTGGTFGGALCLKRGNKKLHKKRSRK